MWDMNYLGGSIWVLRLALVKLKLNFEEYVRKIDEYVDSLKDLKNLEIEIT
jgi:hypothetical protein